MSSAGEVPEKATPGSVADLTLTWAPDHGYATWFSRVTTSTNSIAKSNIAKLNIAPVPTLFLTEMQTAGRGRYDHTWTTPNRAFLSTWSFPLNFAPQPILSPLVGLALFDAARLAFPDVPFNLKAPNDLYFSDRKIAGLLIETVMMASVVTCLIGIGFNAGEAPESLGESAVGLEALLPRALISQQWPAFLSALSSGLTEALAQARMSELGSEARVRLCEALNLHPLLSERVLDVGALGQIHMPSRLINWHEL